ncbi:hypothetical protein P167DRAFT_535095 [Morchella conica CCBAS932]|uniref:Uncharacterized protein n=1 Tax=Morchella conica CCBAS932 TaxID=1392247 RepID=A0A3N4KSA2_9PEZI|nr:hypothetical protein P167DRAFT_535095 [Morchella conica CCBAS932]
MEDGFKKLKDELKDELKETLEKSLATTNDGIKDLRAWVRWIVGTFGIGIMLKLIFYDRYMEEKLEKKQGEMETRLTILIQNAITQLKLELKVEHQERLLSDQNKKNQ